jgi:FkbH-like protein
MDVPRALQIIQKTNQFNMTGLRIDESTLEAMLKNERFYFFQGSLRDKYGDNGNVILSCFEKVSEYRMNILLFNMSCRVIGRNLEYEFLDWSLKSLRSILGVSEFVVHVTPTQKNRNFIDFFEKSGFTSISQDVFMKRGPNQSGISPNFIEIEGTGKWKN